MCGGASDGSNACSATHWAAPLQSNRAVREVRLLTLARRHAAMRPSVRAQHPLACACLQEQCGEGGVPAGSSLTANVCCFPPSVGPCRNSAVKEVHLLGRRGPVQAAFTPKELREMLSLEGVQVRQHEQYFCLAADACLGIELRAAEPGGHAAESIAAVGWLAFLWGFGARIMQTGAHTHPSSVHRLPSPQVKMDPEVFKVSPACEAEMKATRMKKRVFDILSKALAEPKQG